MGSGVFFKSFHPALFFPGFLRVAGHSSRDSRGRSLALFRARRAWRSSTRSLEAALQDLPAPMYSRKSLKMSSFSGVLQDCFRPFQEISALATCPFLARRIFARPYREWRVVAAIFEPAAGHFSNRFENAPLAAMANGGYNPPLPVVTPLWIRHDDRAALLRTY